MDLAITQCQTTSTIRDLADGRLGSTIRDLADGRLASTIRDLADGRWGTIRDLADGRRHKEWKTHA